MNSFPKNLAFLILIASLPGSTARADAPAKTVKKSVSIPKALTIEQALESIEDVPAIFDRYRPAVPWVPGVSLKIEKEVLSRGRPSVVALNLDGSAPFVPNGIHEKAVVSASVSAIPCGPASLSPIGRMIHLDFKGSSRNVERRVDRIDITVCATGSNAAPTLTAIGYLYEGDLPIDPTKNSVAESIAANAIQTAFIKQVEPLVTAVNDLWQP
jgi:hypothetical protein